MIPPAGPHGGDGAAVARALGLDPAKVLDLSMSLNPFAPEVTALATRHLSTLRRYPTAADATKALSEEMGVDASRLVLANGGSEAIALVAGAVGGTVAAEPEFSLHPRGSGPPLWRSNPHSPTGMLASDDEHVDVWDEAFYPLATGVWTRGEGIVVGSLTKLFACPGLRLGYVLADDAERLTAAQPGWPLNGLAAALLPELLDLADLPGWRDAIAARRQEVVDLLVAHGHLVASGDAPWVLVHASGLRAQLAPHGVVVRDCTSFGLPEWTRIGLPDDDGMEQLDRALRSAAASGGPTTADAPHSASGRDGATLGTGRTGDRIGGQATAADAGAEEAGARFADAAARVVPIDRGAQAAAEARQLQLTKPPGSLGRLEALGVQLSAIAGEVPPPIPRPAAVGVFAADHGVVAAGVTPWPQAVTAQMVANIVSGGAAINVLARQVGASVTVVDVGVATDLGTLGIADGPTLLRRRIRPGTADLSQGPAMSRDEARAALDVGAVVASHLVDGGARALVTGEMGIGNTTASAAVVAALTGRPPAEVTGRGTGVDDVTLQRKVSVIERALARLPAGADPVDVLAEVGGLEIAALAGFIVGGASERVPVVVDGLIAGAALLAAEALCPAGLPYVVAGHRSTEPGASAVLDHLGLTPVLDLDLRLGEGSGACLALGPLEAAARILTEMATFDDVGIDRA